ncbi:ATPase [Acetobacter orientalis]|uniref:ATPase n=2 Tax=Acetobacter orientalis TaxID=146474 RepID=A0A252C2V3_9PROT|nr:cell division protein ZapE [Acetobacter orientalis]MDN6041485.1 AFG1 family ATPase [Acetobacter sp.]MCP1214741.1 cell division protein ZapE [Acetobacter orientalis]MCP1218324.1 cell division protein ZapE [Acetobacter orientalis]OUJ01591.1 ATPase [Acetobacter orientalis]OUJ15535.1 ATPase [Acetobacter orientalis]
MNKMNISGARALEQQGPLAVYQARIASGDLKSDPDQARVIERLNQLWQELAQKPPQPAAPSKGLLAGLMRRIKAPEPVPCPRGLYIVGRVGRGKTMVMDLFFGCAPVQRKERIHFLRFMQDVHQKLHALKAANPGMSDPIPPLAKTIAGRAELLCFDEFQVNDIADAMILGRLFEALFAAGVVIVATSNTEPGELFQNRPGADAFKPFIAIIKRELDTVELDSQRDYRRGRQQDRETWLVPADTKAKTRLDEIFARYAQGETAQPVTLEFSGRSFEVDQAAGVVARFDFNSLCGKPRGPNDYLALAKQFTVLVIDDIPKMGQDEANLARRFITLIDALYDNGNLLFASAEATPDQLFTTGEGSDAFARTASRLAEMGSESWLTQGAKAAQAAHRLSRA